ncbi:hypothetical protein M9H77_36353 [Catharanthus roseus]|uniref:Uncharacterized protein n=1 Tax=Catharanthus roseus TaxID=4058 RepID=A0ACB9ZTI5_CATRO|nr:hypothetical protein M9H77_36353 [Catharanthus roseus]
MSRIHHNLSNNVIPETVLRVKIFWTDPSFSLRREGNGKLKKRYSIWHFFWWPMSWTVLQLTDQLVELARGSNSLGLIRATVQVWSTQLGLLKGTELCCLSQAGSGFVSFSKKLNNLR